MKAIKIIRKYWIVIWLVVVVFSLASVISYAAYTGTTTAKRVISLKSGGSIQFTSRYMYLTGKEMEAIQFNYETGTIPGTPVVVVDVCNYDANGNVYGRKLHFKIKARIVHRNGTDITTAEWNALAGAIPTDYTVGYKSHTGSSSANYSTAQTLILTNENQYIVDNNGDDIQFLCTAADKTRYLFETKYPVSDIMGADSEYGIRIEAEIVETYNDINSIWGLLRVINGGAPTKNKWEGKFMDDTSNGKKPSNYDGINYQISGNAEGTVTIEYRSDCVEIDLYDVNSLGNDILITETEPDINGKKIKSLVFRVDPELESAYKLKFYWVISPTSEKAMALTFDDENNIFISTAFTE